MLLNRSLQKKLLSRTQKKSFARSHVRTLAAFVISNGQSRHGPLDRQSYTATAKKIKQMQKRLNLPLF